MELEDIIQLFARPAKTDAHTSCFPRTFKEGAAWLPAHSCTHPSESLCCAISQGNPLPALKDLHCTAVISRAFCISYTGTASLRDFHSSFHSNHHPPRERRCLLPSLPLLCASTFFRAGGLQQQHRDGLGSCTWLNCFTQL